MIFICISFMVRDGEHFLICLLAICISTFENFLFSLCAHFLIGHLLWEVRFLISYKLWLLSPCQMYG
jgi:hypothetical protein